MTERTDGPMDEALDQALCRALKPPRLPEGFAQRLHVRMQATDDTARLREALAAEHARRLAALERGYVRLKRETLTMVIATAFTGGAVAAWAVPWLARTHGLDLSGLLPLLALAIGVASGAAVWVERFGLPWRR